MKKKLLFLVFVLFHFSFSQWSTSPYADSGLYVCPGFDPGIVTFDDGSSVVLGLLSSYIYAQKLDSAGYKVWASPVLVHHNDSSDMVLWKVGNPTWFCTDGDGGAILYWQDYRGAYYTQAGPKNSTTYLQRVDKNGNIRWGTGGIKVNNLEDGLKNARITSDGNGGCVLLLSEIGFGYPNAPNVNYLKIARYNANGERLWCTVLDSASTVGAYIEPNSVIKGGVYYYFNYYYEGNIQQRLIDENGNISSYKYLPISDIAITNDQNVFFSDYLVFPTHNYKVSKVNGKGDTTWIRVISFENFCNERGGILVPDNQGGTYLTHTCNDTIIYFDSLGYVFYKKFTGIDIGLHKFSDATNGLIVTDGSKAKRFDSGGTMIWSNEVVFLQDPQNAYSEYFATDNNGGLIAVYWSTIGGIYAQHTGRRGKLGIVTGIKGQPKNIPLSIELYQNFPNPFNSSTKVTYTVAKKSKILLNVYDVLGRKVITAVDNIQEKGTYVVQVDLPTAASGTYFYRLIADGQIQITHKMLLTK